MVYARFMGDGAVGSAFVYAFQIPNLFRRLLGEGALTAAFIPLFKHKEKTEGEKAMRHTANPAVSALLVFLALASVLLIPCTWSLHTTFCHHHTTTPNLRLPRLP